MTDTNVAQAAQQSIGDFPQLTGLALIERLYDGRLNPPPMLKVFPFTMLRPERDKIELHATPDERVLNLTNTVHGGWTMMMLDTAMSLAALTTLAPGEVGPTHETSVKFVRPIIADAGQLRVVGRVLSRGRSVITLEGKIEDVRERLMAHGTSTCLIVRKGPLSQIKPASTELTNTNF
jgi:uncharacterized protein (TIGR00369 family)